MQLLLPIHILAGGIGLIAGYVALFSAKGATLHRKTGLLFVVAIVTLSLTGALVAFLSASSVSVVMLYWLWRLRVRQSLRGIASVSAPEAI
jgi:uncharacterized membrane protein